MSGGPFGIFVRWRAGEPRLGRTFNEILPDHPLADAPCVACQKPLADGNPVTLLVLGPGDDTEYRQKHTAGRWYVATAIPVHGACLGGVPT